MHKSQQGFALVEGVLAAVLLGILTVTVLGQFGGPLNGSAALYGNVDAKTSSAAAINYTARVLDPVAFTALEARYDCASQEPYTDFPFDYDDPGFFAAGTATTCR